MAALQVNVELAVRAVIMCAPHPFHFGLNIQLPAAVTITKGQITRATA